MEVKGQTGEREPLPGIRSGCMKRGEWRLRDRIMEEVVRCEQSDQGLLGVLL